MPKHQVGASIPLFDLLTSPAENQVITLTAEADSNDLQLFVLRDGVFVRSDTGFTWQPQSPGSERYQLSFATIPAGDYAVRAIKGGYTSELSNTFTIDSTPALRDIHTLRQVVEVPTGVSDDTEQQVDGRVGGIDQNRVPATWDGTNWVDGDGEWLRFEFDEVMSFDKSAVPDAATVQKQLDSGSMLTLNTRTGSYRYDPSPTAEIDIFTLTVSDGAKGSTLTLTFDAKDILDRDGVGADVETRLADLASGGTVGDLNGDGIPDKEQNAVATLAWMDYDRYSSGMDGTLNDTQSIINIAVVEGLSGDAVNTSKQLTGIKVLAATDSIIGGSKPDNADWDPFQFSVEPLDSVGLVDADPNRDGTQIRIVMDISRSGVNEGDFTAYMKYVSQTAIDGYSAQGITLVDLDGNQVTQAGWYDFTRRSDTSDGAKFIVENGKVVAIELILTDNRFGDNDPRVNMIYDPGVPVGQMQTVQPVDEEISSAPPPAFGPPNSPVQAYDGYRFKPLPSFVGAFYTQTFGLPFEAADSEEDRLAVQVVAQQKDGLADRGYAGTREFSEPTLNSTALKNVVPLDVATPSAPSMPEVALRNVLTPADLQVTADKDVIYQLPNGTFVGGVGAITLTARLVDGQPLPDWITFDPVTGKFVVDAPAGLVVPIEVLIEATDSQGNTASTVLKVEPVPVKTGLVGKPSLASQLQQLTGTWG